MKDFNHLQNILCCPFCNCNLKWELNHYTCDNCKDQYPIKDGQIDFRLKREKNVSINFIINEHNSINNLKLILLNSKDINLEMKTNINKPANIPFAFLPYLTSKSNGMLALDLGCGDLRHKEFIELQGYNYVGLDYNHKMAALLGDAHALPFHNNTFDIVISMAVLEHIQYPFVMMNEVKRVLKKEGYFLGSVSFLEPFHDNSFYHHTYNGVFNVLNNSGLKIIKIIPNKKWLVLTANASMILFPLIPRMIKYILVKPSELFSKMLWWFASKINKKVSYYDYLLKTTGAYYFIAKKGEI